MEVLVLDTNFIDVDIVDSFDSLIWAERYFKCGDFEIYTPVDGAFLTVLQPDYYLWMNGSDHVMIVEGRQIGTDPEEGNHLVFTGRSLESILDRRIIWAQTILTGNFQNGVQKLLNENAISPTDPDRVIPNLIFEASADPIITALTIQAQFTGDNLYDSVCSLCEANGIGFRITLTDGTETILTSDLSLWEAGHYNGTTGIKEDTGVGVGRIRVKNLIRVSPFTTYVFDTINSLYKFTIRAYDISGNFVRNKNSDWGRFSSGSKTTLMDEYYLGISIYLDVAPPTSEEVLTALGNKTFQPSVRYPENKFKFKLYAGTDRSYDQIANPYVEFSPNFDNLLNSNYAETKKSLKTVSLVAGEGEGAARKTTTVSAEAGAGAGLARREMFTDARDISSNIDGGTLTTEQYNAQLAQRGMEKLAKNVFVSSFEGAADTSTLYKYGEDFFMGDVLQLANEYDMNAKTRVVEFIRSQSAAGEETYPTFAAI